MNETAVGTLVGIAIGLVLVALLVVIFRWLWNSTMPEIFGVREVSLWQAVKILLLAGILFGSNRMVDLPPQVTKDPVPHASPSP